MLGKEEWKRLTRNFVCLEWQLGFNLTVHRMAPCTKVNGSDFCWGRCVLKRWCEWECDPFSCEFCTSFCSVFIFLLLTICRPPLKKWQRSNDDDDDDYDIW